MKRTNIFAILGCALLALTLASCGSSNKLQTITLSAALVNGVAPQGQSGFVTLTGNGGTIQLAATGEYGSTKTKDLTNEVTYTVVVDPQHNVDAFGDVLIPPCTPPSCPSPATPPYTRGTVEYSSTGLITAVEPATCTFIDVAPLDPTSGNPTTPSWLYTGDYVVTATFDGVTSQPMYVPVASSGGSQFYNGQENNPDGFCDSGSY